MAESDVVKLKVRDLGVRDVSEVFGLEPPVPITLRRKKTNAYTITFIGKKLLRL
ncbi:MAG: hypothetical protein QXP55_03585 [Nitrososphaerales archaeon]